MWLAWWALGEAVAQEASPWWAGAWGLDPSESDDPLALVEADFRAPTMPSASRLAPDNAVDASEDAYARARDATLRALNRSGRVEFEPAGELVNVRFDQSEISALTLDGHWAKASDESGRYKVRLWDEGVRLTVERRYRGLVLRETWLAPASPESDELAVVVALNGATMGSGVEFRRVYRRL